MTLSSSFSGNKEKNQAEDQFTTVGQYTSILTEKFVLYKKIQNLKISRTPSN